MISVVMTNVEKAILTIAPITSTGKPASLDGVPTWIVNDPDATLGPIVASADGLACEVPSSDGVTGSTGTVTVEADADLGAGVVVISETFGFTINHPMAASLQGAVSVVPK